jgi:hypothetical protein
MDVMQQKAKHNRIFPEDLSNATDWSKTDRHRFDPAKVKSISTAIWNAKKLRRVRIRGMRHRDGRSIQFRSGLTLFRRTFAGPALKVFEFLHN